MEAMQLLGPKHGSMFFNFSHINSFSVTNVSCFPLKSFPGKHTMFVRMKATTTHSCNGQESDRKFMKLPLSKWGDFFLSTQVDVSDMDALSQEMETLKPKVEDLFISCRGVESTKKRIIFIYTLLSLGVAYQFQDEIEKSLKQDFNYIEKMMSDEDDMYVISTIFWVFRTYGYNMSSDVFKRFTEENGKFKESLNVDVKGMLSLYEAAHLRTTTDHIMDEALSFTTSNLKSLVAARACPPHVTTRIRNALCMPQHYNVEMIFAKEYISFYEQEEGHNKMLLRFSKINFKFMQLNWIKELKILTKWWKEQNLASKLPPYYKDRMIECYIYAFIVYFEPQFSRARTEITKLYTLLTIIDDTCDRYGSISEVEALVHCMERWDPECTDDLPDYMKAVFELAFNTFKECEEAGKSDEGSSYSVQGALEEFKISVRANFCFTQWAQSDMVPTFDEYLEIGAVEVTTYVAIACGYLGLHKHAREKGFEWLKSRPKLVQAQAKKARLVNDLNGYQDDISRGYLVNAVEYYVNQYGVTKEEALMALQKMINDFDKIVNEELLKERKIVPREILKQSIDFEKMVNFTYRSGREEFTHPEGILKEYITSLFVNFIHL